MASVRVPPNCAGMTLATAGVVAAVAGVISGIGALEATALVSPYSFPGSLPLQTSALVGGAVNLQLPLVITNITVNGTGYAVDATGKSAAIPAADAAAFMLGLKDNGCIFKLVQG